MTLPVITGVAYAYANHGRWVADCPYPYCTNAMGLLHGQGTFCCEGPDACGTQADILWPPDPHAIETLLSMRPAYATRNWLPGETLTDLLAENTAHNVLPPDWTAGLEPGGQRIAIDVAGERVVGGLLYEQLVAADPTREIGA